MSAESSPHEKTLDAGLLLPVQYADLVRRNHVIEGELKLLLAVLEDAIRCYLRNVNAKDGERRREFVEVRAWFEGSIDGSRCGDIFSFENLCAALSIDPRVLLDAPANPDYRRPSVAALPDAPASTSVEPPPCQRRARTRLRSLSWLVTTAPQFGSNCQRVALPWNSPGVASTPITLRGRTAKIGPMSSTVSTFKSHSYFGL